MGGEPTEVAVLRLPKFVRQRERAFAFRVRPYNMPLAEMDELVASGVERLRVDRMFLGHGPA